MSHALDKKDIEGMRILLAEDNDLNAEIAITLLEEVGFLVDRAENGVECMIERRQASPLLQ